MVIMHNCFKVFHFNVRIWTFILTWTFYLLLKGLSSGDSTPLMQENELRAATGAVGNDESAEVNANNQPEARKPALQSLFSLIQGEVEQLDSRALPLCLHQVTH